MKKSTSHHMNTILLFLTCFILSFPSIGQASTPILSIDTGGHKALIRNVIFTSDGRYLISTSDDKTVRVWDTDSGEIVRIIRGEIGKGDEGKIYAAALSSDDRWLALGGWLPGSPEERRSIRLIDFRSGEVVRLLIGHTNVISSLAFSPDGRYLISGSGDKSAKIWQVDTGDLLQTLKGHSDLILEVAFSPDSRHAVTGSNDDTLRQWQVSNGKLLKTMQGHSGDVRALSYSPDGRYILSGSNDKTIRLWDSTGTFIKVLAEQNRTVESLSVSPDSTRVVTGHGVGKGSFVNNVFSIPDGKKLTSFREHKNAVLATAISLDGSTVASGGGSDVAIYLWDITSAKVKNKMVGRGKRVLSVGFSKDGRSIAWGRKWEKSNVFRYGSLNQSFHLASPDTRAGQYDISMGEELHSDSGYLRALESVGKTTIRTKNSDIQPTLEVLQNGSVHHEITRDATNGSRHNAITLSADGKTIVSGGSFGYLTSYDPATGKKLYDFIGHTSDVVGVAVSPDSKLLVSGSTDQTVKLWELVSGKLLVNIFQGIDNEWVAWTPEGYYASSLKGDRYIGWQINQGLDKKALYYPASRFASDYYSPETVAAYITTGGDIDRAITLANTQLSKSKQVEKTENIKNLLPPEVVIVEPLERDVTISGNTLRLRAKVRSLTAEPITDIWVLVNGRRIDKNRKIVRLKKSSTKVGGLVSDLDIEVPLNDELNKVSVIAKNRHSQSEPEIINVSRRTVAARETQTGDIFKPSLYLLSVGVSEYENPSYSLDVAHKDAEAISALFSGQDKGLYKNVKSKLLTDKDATKDNILDSLDWLLSEATQRDTAVIFIAGHGMKDTTGNYYFLPHDGDPEKLRRSAVKWYDFQDTLVNLPSKVILMVDTCHSGAVTGKRRGMSDITDALRELTSTDSGVVVMTAATGREVSQERREWGHGAFTKALVEGLKGKADYNSNNIITIKEIDLYVTERVKELTNGTQHPTTEIPKTLPNFPITVH